MCGIAGIIGEQNKNILADMVDSLRHRGPDEDGTIHGRSLSMGMRRLSIVDLSGGTQPISNEDESIWIVFNGEIYNHNSLRQELCDSGHHFSTDADTEAIVHGYEEWGVDVVEHLNGMFAFAIWDQKQDCVVIARDRLGIKPLYYAPLEDSVVFGSELTALLDHPDIESTISETALQQYWALRYIPAPESILAGVRKLPPATVATIPVNDLAVSQKKYWSLDTAPSDSSQSIRSLLESSVEQRLMSDVPLGTFLSGGLDSTVITALMTEVSNDPVRTFSVGFAESSYDESSFSRRVADDLGTDHHELIVDSESMCIFDDVVKSIDEPLADPALIPTYLLSEHAAKKVKVVLTGEGSDELFAGYDYYGQHTDWWKKVKPVPASVHQMADKVQDYLPSGSKSEKYLRYLASYTDQKKAITTMNTMEKEGLEFTSEEVRDVVSELVETVVRPEREYLTNLLQFDQQYSLPDNLLNKVDRMTMANCLEARVPFLDHRIVERTNSIQSRRHLEGHTKPVLRHEVRDIVPKYVLERNKHGFNVPISEWFAKPLDQIEDIFDTNTLRTVPYVDPKKAQSLLSLHQSSNRDYSAHLWRILIYAAWYDKNIN